MSSQPLVSIVTPVYNTEKYLGECIESVLSQTYENWEYVIVNNCSTDRSLEIAEHYASRDARIRVHNNAEFLNQMQNCNHALRQISPDSKYCKVVHADDWIFPECLTRMVEVGEDHPSVGIIGAYRLDEATVNLDGLPYLSVVTSGRDICRRYLLEHMYLFGSPTSLLIRSDLIGNRTPFYIEGTLQADVDVCFDILQKADFGFVHQVLTYTRRHNESASNKISLLFGTGQVNDLKLLKEYGPRCLSNEEQKIAFKSLMKRYYRFLGQSIFRLRKRLFWARRKEFWDYHRKSLEELGYRFEWVEILKGALVVLMAHLVNRISE
jgi:glycosyltransferase involved in cell wall biosynthesis